MEGGRIELSDIQRFYKDSTVFLTGATGFIGKLFLEKVLKTLPVKKVFILVRSKNDLSVEQRLQAIFESEAFDPLKRLDAEAFNKVHALNGDCSLPDLGLSNEDAETLRREVDVIFHSAASIRSDDHIKNVTLTNVRATKDLMELAKKIPKLKTFVYVGTAFSNSNRTEIREEIYPPRISAEKLIAACESLDEKCLTSMTKTLIADWPNNYTFTKQVTEDYISREGKNIPICIVRPTIVVSTSDEPVKAFVDSTNSLVGMHMLNMLGMNRISYYRNNSLDIIPADFVVNGCIAAGWITGEAFRRQKGDTPVFNLSSSTDNPISQDEVYNLTTYYAHLIPSISLLAYPLYFRTTCKYNYYIMSFLLHTLVAHFADLLLKIQGKEPMFVMGLEKLRYYQEAYEPYITTPFFIHTANTNKLLKKMSFRDRELFNFDVTQLDWSTYFSHYCKGVRIYLMKESMDTVPEGRKRYNYVKKIMIAFIFFSIVTLYVIGKVLLFRMVPLLFALGLRLLQQVVCQ